MAEQNPLRPVLHSNVQPNVNIRTNIVQPLNIPTTIPPATNEFNMTGISITDNAITEALCIHQCNNLTVLLGTTETMLLETRRQLFEAINTQQYYLSIINLLRTTIRHNEIEIQTLTNHYIELQNELEDVRSTENFLDLLDEAEERQDEMARQIPSLTTEADE